MAVILWAMILILKSLMQSTHLLNQLGDYNVLNISLSVRDCMYLFISFPFRRSICRRRSCVLGNICFHQVCECVSAV